MRNPLTPNWRTGLVTGALVLAVAAYGNHTAQQQQANNAEAEDAAAIASRRRGLIFTLEAAGRAAQAYVHMRAVLEPRADLA